MNDKPLIFISDVHLCPSRPKITQGFLKFLHYWSSKAQALYILGDFFDSWIGDDDLNDFSRAIIQALRHFVNQNTPCYFMHGNHDFLIQKRFCAMTGIQILPDPHVISHINNLYLMTHGDYLCIDDIEHQKFRNLLIISKKNQSRFLMMPRWLRRIIRDYVKRKSINHQKQSLYINDINHEFAAQECKKYKVNTLIHGHTHQPIIAPLNGHSSIKRITLPAWEEHGGYLEIDTNNNTVLKRFNL